MRMHLVVFRINREEYAILVEKVTEIFNYVPVTSMPGSPNYFEGIINDRGKIVPVVDFATKMGLLGTQERNGQIVIVEAQGKEVGLTVDTVTEVIQAASENFASVESSESSDKSFKKVYKFHCRIITLLDIEQVLSASA